MFVKEGVRMEMRGNEVVIKTMRAIVKKQQEANREMKHLKNRDDGELCRGSLQMHR